MPEVPDIVKQKDKLSRSGSRSNAKNVALSSSSSATKKDVYGVDAAFEASSGASLENSIGAKMLKQMGWNDGQGLGKKNQGRSRIIEVERRAAGAGLGAKVSKPVSGESYKDAVKRTMMERYKQLHEQELNSKM